MTYFGKTEYFESEVFVTGKELFDGFHGDELIFPGANTKNWEVFGKSRKGFIRNFFIGATTHQLHGYGCAQGPHYRV